MCIEKHISGLRWVHRIKWNYIGLLSNRDMIPSTDKMWNSFRVSIGRHIIFSKFLFFGEYRAWALRITSPPRPRFCSWPTRYMQYEVEAFFFFFRSNDQEVVLTFLWAGGSWYLLLIQLYINRRENEVDPVLKSGLFLFCVS